MHRAWRSLGAHTAASGGVVLVIAAVITLVLGVGLTRLEFATGDDSYINEGSEIAIARRPWLSG
jgi:uncharacterized membrane protein YdfJ with MMPL/SSD domain